MCKGAIFSKFFNFSGLKTAYQQQSKSSAYQKAHLTNSASQRTFLLHIQSAIFMIDNKLPNQYLKNVIEK